MLHQITEFLQIPEEELHWSYSRAGGPGGQNVNKVSSKATLRWSYLAHPALPMEAKLRIQRTFPAYCTSEGELLISSQEYRDQPRNRERCVEKLRHILVVGLTKPKLRKATKPSRGANRRRLEAKKQNAARKASRKPNNWD